jgi:hypothetical protein
MFRTRHDSAGRSHRWLVGIVAGCALVAAAVLPGSTTITTTTNAALVAKSYQARHLVAAGTGQREEPRTAAGNVNILTGAVGGGQGDSDWRLSTGSGARSTSRHVNFTVPFAQVPQVSIGLVSIDTGTTGGVRVTVAASNITRYGFDAVFTTWLDSTVYDASANWIAFG